MKQLKLMLSTEAVITASDPRLAFRLKKRLERHGLSFSLSKEARDLGLTHTAAAKRPSKLVINRCNKVNIESIR